MIGRPPFSRCLAGTARLWWLTLELPDIQGVTWADFRALIIARYGLLLPKVSGSDVIIEVEIIAYMVRVAAPEDDYLPVPVDDTGIPKPLFEGDNNKVDPVDFLAAPKDSPVIIIASDDDEEDAEEVIEDIEDDPKEILFVVPQVPEGHQEVPRNVEVPLAPVGVQTNLPLIREDMLYERFRRMKAPEFEGPTDPIEADNWLTDIQVILDFMGLTEQEKVICASFALKKGARHWWITMQMRMNVTTMSWQDFMTEFRAMYYNREILAAQQDKFNSFRQGSMTVMEAVKKFEQIVHLCPELVPNETEKVRSMMKMFQTNIAKQVSAGSSPSTLVSDCISRAIRAEYWINQDKEARAQIFKAKKEEKAVVKQSQPRRNPESNMKGQSGNAGQNSRQFGKNKRQENAIIKIEGSYLAQERLEAPEPQARIYAYTKGNIEAGTSSVVTGQISVATYDALALLDSGATHSEKFFCLTTGYEVS
ncbi:hypothetical protein TIFTF001_020458 [Ficus carica]|uniref:Retrotransposon gag domain-containing protein n=1 Tax=Ficus carica TaxID=3494 RepID=A0AA88AU25_FICCA|nr:hypothetical protein TIFTF001_020458 [Ficus carica]